MLNPSNLIHFKILCFVGFEHLSSLTQRINEVSMMTNQTQSMCGFMTGLHSEKRFTGRFCPYMNILEFTYPNLKMIHYYTSRLYGTYCQILSHWNVMLHMTIFRCRRWNMREGLELVRPLDMSYLIALTLLLLLFKGD